MSEVDDCKRRIEDIIANQFGNLLELVAERKVTPFMASHAIRVALLEARRKAIEDAARVVESRGRYTDGMIHPNNKLDVAAIRRLLNEENSNE